MSSIAGFISVVLTALLVENVVFIRLLGITPILKGTRSVKTAALSGLVISALTCVTSLLCSLLNGLVLVPRGLEYLRTFLYIIIIAACLSLVGHLLRRRPAWYARWKSMMPYLTANCVVLGAALMVTEANYSPFHSAAFGLFAGLGFTFCALLFAAVCERLRSARCPKAFEGMPIALVTFGLIAMVFLGFTGLRL